MRPDFGGYATKAGLKCSDGLTIMPGAFKDDDQETVPLVWQHLHEDPKNVIGHAKLLHRDDGVYTQCYLNNSENANVVRELLKHQDVDSLSIRAGRVVKRGMDVIHGVIQEVSVVLSGANPGALIDFVNIQHSDGTLEEREDEAIIYTGLTIDRFEHASESQTQESESKVADSEKTVADVFNTLNEEQKNVVYYMIGTILDENGSDTEQDSFTEGDLVHHNIFEPQDQGNSSTTLTHSQIQEIFHDLPAFGSLKDSVLAHAATYGIDNIDILFPDAQALDKTPQFIKRRTEWVSGVLGGTHHSPFTRIKTVLADITPDSARAKGYVKGTMKKEEVFGLLQRKTTPSTIYKKQKLDRDDILDITDFDVVAWVKAEMRLMLDEEIARSVLVGDGREVDDPDKIKDPAGSNEGAGLRSIYHDDDLYAHHTTITPAVDQSFPEAIIEAAIRALDVYEGTGTPDFYTTRSILTDMLLLKDGMGRRLYSTKAELASAMGVNSIIDVPIMKDLSRVDGASTLDLVGIMVHLSDYTVGADKGGEISFFDDFDIDYNQEKYLYETRLSGALTKIKSAVVLEKAHA